MSSHINPGAKQTLQKLPQADFYLKYNFNSDITKKINLDERKKSLNRSYSLCDTCKVRERKPFDHSLTALMNPFIKCSSGKKHTCGSNVADSCHSAGHHGDSADLVSTCPLPLWYSTCIPTKA